MKKFLQVIHNPDNDPRGPLDFSHFCSKSGSASLLTKKNAIRKKSVPPNGRYWSCSKDTFEKSGNKDNRIWFWEKWRWSTKEKETFLSEVQSGLRPNTIFVSKMKLEIIRKQSKS